MKIIFLGTPDFAVTVLQKLIDSEHQVVAVVCQPDKPVGRKQILTAPPVKELAIKNNIPVFQFNKIRNEGVSALKQFNADILVTTAYGQILSQEILDLTPYGVINVHASLLPKYKGSSPIQWCLINGEEKTGVTIMKTDIGMDTGDMILKQEVKIAEEDSVSSLFNKLSIVGADLLLKALSQIENGTAVFEKQNNEQSSYYPMLKKENAVIDFSKSSKEIVNFIRGLEEWPTAYAKLGEENLKIYKAKIVNQSEDYSHMQNGTIIECSGKKGVLVKTLDGILSLELVQLGSGKKMDGKSFGNGHKDLQGKVLN